jgi:DNA-binding transcriptional LysR family regulator
MHIHFIPPDTGQTVPVILYTIQNNPHSGTMLFYMIAMHFMHSRECCTIIELNQLQQFLSVVSNGTVSKAADELHLTQPALSRSLQRLEEELQVPLFDRGKNKITLNDCGKIAAEQARLLLDRATQMEQQIREYYQKTQTVRIGSCAPCEAVLLIRKLAGELFPGIPCTAEIEDEAAVINRLRTHEYHTGIILHELPGKEFFQIRLGSEQLYALLPPGHQFEHHNQGIFFKDIDGEAAVPLPLKGYWMSLIAAKMTHSTLIYQTTVEGFDRVIHASTLISFASDVLLRDHDHTGDHTAVKLLDPEAHITYYAVCLNESKNQYMPLFTRLASEMNID